MSFARDRRPSVARRLGSLLLAASTAIALAGWPWCRPAPRPSASCWRCVRRRARYRPDPAGRGQRHRRRREHRDCPTRPHVIEHAGLRRRIQLPTSRWLPWRVRADDDRYDRRSRDHRHLPVPAGPPGAGDAAQPGNHLDPSTQSLPGAHERDHGRVHPDLPAGATRLRLDEPRSGVRIERATRDRLRAGGVGPGREAEGPSRFTRRPADCCMSGATQ